MQRGASVLLVACLVGCGGPAIVDASRGVAGLRGCEPAQLTMAEADDRFMATNCGDPALYTCEGERCAAADGAADTAWVEAAMGAMAAIEQDVSECTDGASVTVQIVIDEDGRVSGLASHPELESEARLCVGRLVFDNVSLDAGPTRLVAFAFGDDAGQSEPDAMGEPEAMSPDDGAPDGDTPEPEEPDAPQDPEPDAGEADADADAD